MDAKEIRKLDKEQLTKTLQERVNEYMKYNRELKSGEEKNTAKKKTLKNEIARLKTIIREKELIESTK